MTKTAVLQTVEATAFFLRVRLVLSKCDLFFLSACSENRLYFLQTWWSEFCSAEYSKPVTPKTEPLFFYCAKRLVLPKGDSFCVFNVFYVEEIS